jgi:hypothetical protein
MYYDSLLRERLVGWIESNCVKEYTTKLPLPVVKNIIRFQTFEVLGVTHTCCHLERYWYSGIPFPFRPHNPTEMVEFREEEYKMRQELDVLVEKFVEAFEEREESLESFLQGFWGTEMARVLTTVEPPTGEQIEELRSNGVVIESIDDNGTGTRFDGNAQVSDRDWFMILQKFSGR